MTKGAYAFIFARGGSKGVPNKNIKLLAGKPLIGYAIETALACECFESVIVSTDRADIAEVARGFGATTPFMRPPELATDTAAEWLAWQHAIRFVESHYGAFDIFASLPATSPFRNVSDVLSCLNALKSDANADIVITGRRAERSPYFNMVKLDQNNYAQIVIPPANVLVRRQDAPVVYDMTTVAYVSRPQFILSAENLWRGKVRLVEVSSERSMDIDTPHDFFLAECIANAHPDIHLT